MRKWGIKLYQYCLINERYHLHRWGLQLLPSLWCFLLFLFVKWVKQEYIPVPLLNLRVTLLYWLEPVCNRVCVGQSTVLGQFLAIQNCGTPSEFQLLQVERESGSRNFFRCSVHTTWVGLGWIGLRRTTHPHAFSA